MSVKTFEGKDGNHYLVFGSLDGGFHTYVEVEAKQAARECGADEGSNTRSMWESIWS
jgi:hypothetical protein